MRVEISEYEKKYFFELMPVTQLCGQNIRVKSYLVESLRRYFGTFKYPEIKNKWRDNVSIDGEILGRKHFRVLCVKGIQDLLTLVKWSKQSLMLEYVKSLMDKFDWQAHLNVISDEMDLMFQMLNEEIETLGNIELNYDESELWDIIQKSTVTGQQEEPLEDKSGDELINIALNLIEAVLKVKPEKTLVILENPDHYVSVTEYKDALERMQEISRSFDIHFLNTVSLDGYVDCREELCEGISVFNEVSFQMPELEMLLQVINDNYPCNKVLEKEKLQTVLESIIHKIGKVDYLESLEENVVCKIINQSLLLNDRWDDTENLPEISFLKA